MKASNQKNTISFIIPAMNEEVTIETLVEGIQAQVSHMDWEILLIDDGSTDGTWRSMKRMQDRYPHNIKTFQFRANRGKADALALGYKEAQGDIIFTMDADLQDDPQEIPRFIQAIEEGADLVSGWKKKRHDPWHKVLPSRVFNAVISRLTGVSLHDHNCGFKAYRKEAAKSLPMYGDMHRMVPSLASFQGYKTLELEVEHHPRMHGVSKYGWGRMLIGLMDTATVCFLQRYRNCPMHFMGNVSLAAGVLGGVSFSAALAMTFLKTGSAMPFFMTGIILLVLAVIVAVQGLVMEHRVHEKMKGGRNIPALRGREGRTPKVVQYESLKAETYMSPLSTGVTLNHAS